MPRKLWKDFVLLAGDGSTIALPSSKKIKDYFGVHSTNQHGANNYLARIFYLYDCLNNFIIDAHISKMSIGEKSLLTKSLSRLDDINQKFILLLDRGFGNFGVVKEISSSNNIFCIRMSESVTNFIKKAAKHPENDIIAIWEPSKKEKENAKKNGLDYQPVKVRVVKIILKTGETEFLVTNLLDQSKYTIEDLEALYHLRWSVEEGFKNLKSKMKIEYFGAKIPEGIFQEFYAHLFIVNLVGLMGMATSEEVKEKTKDRKYEYKCNWKNCYRFIRAKIINFCLFNQVDAILENWRQNIVTSLIAIIEGRKFTRNTKNKDKPRNHMCYK